MEDHKMVFMVGVGRIANGSWSFTTFVAGGENSEQEKGMFARFLDYLDREKKGGLSDSLRQFCTTGPAPRFGSLGVPLIDSL